MKTFNVTIPCTMSVTVTVEAESEEAAKDAALDVDFRVDIKSDDGKASPEIYDFECHRQICQGNVFHGVLNEMEVEEV